ncbi:MAG: tRNA uridine-5-carboxymethylaminomethyl(34) synthesis GTPase MnmE [Candidatus Metalachnospira sp.]|nr:tRNA uridine-5-carboxymethylaminomethyl(34) synthesis GTPase MnmE [Candidatus Metalachnospira sp.]
MKKIALDDVIAAVSTPIGNGGIGIVRLSGTGAVAVADKIFTAADGKKLKNKKSHTITYGHIVDSKSLCVIDEVLVMLMLAPKTYTNEDVVEINCHGGMLVTNKVLELVLNNGARIAEPGEFTKRAFLNGRIDLSQAEAVMDLIESKTELSRQTAINQLEGSIKEKVHFLRDELLDMIAAIEAAIDYPEHDVEEETYSEMYKRIKSLIERINKLLEFADTGKIIREGVQAVILGKPNVGKSSLLNLMLMEERAIVTDIPGTTRDTVEEYMNFGGIPVKIIDTAGIRDTGDAVEKIGVEKSRKCAENADIIFMMIDASLPLSSEDIEILEFIKNKKSIILVNKTDIDNKIDFDKLCMYTDEKNIIYISVKEDTGIDKLTERFMELFFGGEIQTKDSVIISNVRHKNMLCKAAEALERAIVTIETRMPEDFISMDLQEALSALGEITGDSVDDEIIDRIFTRFCLGK